MTATATTPRLTRTEYCQQLQAALADLSPSSYGHNSISVQGLRIYIEANNSQQLVSGVSIEGGIWRRHNRRPSFRNLDLAHIEKAVRRKIAERDEEDGKRKAYQQREAERDQREQLAAKRVLAAVETINDRSCAARYGRLVTKVEVCEHTKETGEHVYRWELDLQALSEAQALAILAIVEESRPWEPAPTVEELFTPDEERCTSTCSQMRCQLPAGHGPYHKCGAAGWEEAS